MAVSIREALKRASLFLEAKGIEDALFLAEYAIRHVKGWDRTRFFASMGDELSQQDWLKVESIIKRRGEGEPFQYIVGEQEFYGLTFKVNPSVLIPRPETELLVEEILKKATSLWPPEEKLAVADIGTGSGAIIVTLAVEGNNNWEYIATDIAQESLDTAALNAKNNGVGDKISFVQGDLLAPLRERDQRVDILVSNPPYIPSYDVTQLDVQVKAHEPLRALDGGEDGLDFYRRMARDLPDVLQNKALLGLEVGIHQSEAVRGLLLDTGLFHKVYIIDDLQGIGRHVLGLRDSNK
ncbi:peptide chain release factor N(5)-glutamine methyltransferase [Aneurinibacillus sp. Ricciae_BoGa-3]|uniref:peptide chain release factor N(5)-glutamine methyltransferase n=1 Tax=Aneurinibacillus sp. Ricciae_BoGa-3 TaxID=3022697 RepID=UPI002341CACA|nr:peptide chain release factor N(5)-glutamine methyltransferase [Aneurinibacillus sp. Ricciae_BoGa-3]WCK54364.1 peptide chain release factor N(5)-glutamine methyltransferase [Aneurinibacillus sp. Ricciae_BoGa-3]